MYVVSPNMFRFFINHLQGESGTSKNQQYNCIACYIFRRVRRIAKSDC